MPPKRPIPQKPNIQKPIPQKPVLQKNTQSSTVQNPPQKPQIQKPVDPITEVKPEEKVELKENAQNQERATVIEEKNQPVENKAKEAEGARVVNKIENKVENVEQQPKKTIAQEPQKKAEVQQKSAGIDAVKANKSNEKSEQSKEVLFGMLGGVALVFAIVCFVLMFVL